VTLHLNRMARKRARLPPTHCLALESMKGKEHQNGYVYL
jgi:hypothetical protein